jgi:hypothetical protein
MKRRDFLAAAGLAAALDLPAPAEAGHPERVKFLFMDERDIYNSWGRIGFRANPLKKIAANAPPFTVKYCLRKPEGSYDVWGFRGADHKPWALYRARSADGIHFEDVRVVLERTGTHWAHTCSVSYSPEQKRFLFLKNANVEDGFSMYAFTSTDGDHWEEHGGNPVFYEGDRWGALWSSTIQRFIYYGKGIQRINKRIPELFIDARRVVTLRTSADGFAWTPDSPAFYRRGAISPQGRDGGFRRVGGPLVPVEFQIAPDEADPPDLEFYAGDGFHYEDRYYLLMLNYAASPLPPGIPPVGHNGHGPALDTEWWVSRNGRDWQRPFRGMDAGQGFLHHNPMIAGARLIFHDDSGIWSVPEDRITCATARSNATFDTAQFPAAGRPVRVNARIPGEGYSNYQNQGYIMAELIDDLDKVIPGYEKDRCVFQGPLDSLELSLRWDKLDGSELRDRRIRVRLHFRAADIYAVTA